MAGDPLALGPLVGNLWVPVWAIRPGTYRAIAPVADAMPLWLALHSRNADFWKPAYTSREQLGATLGITRNTVSRKLEALRKAGLLFEVKRGMDPATMRHRARARWALDPFTIEKWRPKVEASLQRVQLDDGQNGRWLHRAVTALDAFERGQRILRGKIEEDMPPDLVQRQRQKEASRRKRAREKAMESEPRPKFGPGPKTVREGMGFTRGDGGNAEGRDGPEKRNGRPDGARRDSTPHQQGSEKMGPKSAVAQTRDPTESLAAQGASVGHDSK